MDANASYIVAGGFGGIGRAILRWMADRGAKNLIVPSTSGTSSQAAVNVVSELARRGVRVITKICNAASDTDLAALLQDCALSMPPIKGCINAAMVLQVCASPIPSMGVQHLLTPSFDSPNFSFRSYLNEARAYTKLGLGF